MKTFFKSVILCAAVIFAVPAAAGGLKTDKPEDIPASVTAMPQSHTIKLLCSATGGITETDIEDYAVYAVLEEVPFIPDTEALKAQVCAARTYAARRILAGESENGAHISDDSSKYQTALTESAAMAVYGGGYDEAIVIAQVQKLVYLLFRNFLCSAQKKRVKRNLLKKLKRFHTVVCGYKVAAYRQRSVVLKQ